MIDYCDCGARLHLGAAKCERCRARVVFDIDEHRLRPMREGEQKRLCANASAQCNWLLSPNDNDKNEGGGFCRSCKLSAIVPPVRGKRSLEARRTFERAKKRLLLALMRLKLFPQYATFGGMRLEINMMEDNADNPNVADQWVPTGHLAGVITINAREADRAALEMARREFGEKYRTLLGHLRHESGHYFWHVLVQPNAAGLAAFRELFGDEREDYGEALKKYYATPARRRNRKNEDYITPYARAHAHEDWAESWAHFLHLEDALAAARDLGLAPPPAQVQQTQQQTTTAADKTMTAADDKTMTMAADKTMTDKNITADKTITTAAGEKMITTTAGQISATVAGDDFDERLKQWLDTAAIINEMNAALGLRPAYPFSPRGKAAEKMRFIHTLIRPPSPLP